MIASIINAGGDEVHRGNTIDAKFIRLVAQEGNSQVVEMHNFDKANWNGSSWIEVLPTATENWMKEMKATDQDIPRPLEDVLDMTGTTGLASATLDKYNAKKDLRATKP